jgi:hypothetical protein
MADHESGRHDATDSQGVPSRFSAAMTAIPRARDWELAPLQNLSPARHRHLLDLFAGEGYVSRTLGKDFSRRTMIDIRRIEAPGRLTKGSSLSTGATRITGDATDPAILRRIPGAVDYAVCLAGYHHAIVESAGRIDTEATKRSRVQTLRHWRDLLVPGGLLAVADVPERGLGVSTTPGRESGSSLEFEGWSGPKTEVSRRLAGQVWTEPDPAGFFDDVVALARVGGHDAVFETPENLAASFAEAGFADIHAAIVPTPWEFPTEEHAVWFVHELLTIGARAETPADLSASEYRSLRQAIERYLGLRHLSDGNTLVLWKLLYVWGTNRVRD